MIIINGDNIQKLCHHYIGTRIEFTPGGHGGYNPTLEKYKIIVIDDLKKCINNNSLVFVYTGLLYNIEELIKKLRFLKNKFSIVFFNQCRPHFNKEYLKIFEVENLQRIFTQNINCIHSRVTPLPLGLTRNMYSHGDMSKVHKVINMKISKRKGIFFNFSIGTNPKHRQECYDKIKEKGIKWIENKSFEDYLKELASHKFCISPEGNGIDCHRTWESLYLKTIPICKRSILTEHFSKIFPIILIDDWGNLPSLRYNDYNWENYDKLDFSYWKNIIN